MNRRTMLATAGSLAVLGRVRPAWADTPGVTATEIKIGQTMAYSGPASAYGTSGRGLSAYFKRANDQGGVAGRMINFISVDDGYSPPKTVEQTRRLVEQEGVAFMLLGLGTAPNTAVQKYLNQKKVPQLFVASGADKWANPKEFPWTIGFNPSYRTEGQIWAKYVLANKPDGKIAFLYQNDDLGKDYVAGVRDVLGDRFDRMVVKLVSYEVTDPTIDSQAVAMQGSGADVLLTAATPKFAAQIIRKTFDLGWKPLHLLTNVSSSVATVILPAGAERAVGIVTAGFIKDLNDPAWSDDPGMAEWRGFMKEYMPDSDLNENNYLFAYAVGGTAMQMLKQCEGNFSRENILKQATNLHNLQCPTLLPGILVNTAPDNYHTIRQLQLARWNGARWERFGEVIQGSEV